MFLLVNPLHHMNSLFGYVREGVFSRAEGLTIFTNMRNKEQRGSRNEKYFLLWASLFFTRVVSHRLVFELMRGTNKDDVTTWT